MNSMLVALYITAQQLLASFGLVVLLFLFVALIMLVLLFGSR